jgi:hypothetical protein
MDRTTLLELLGRIRTTVDVGRLFVGLGYAPDDRPNDETSHIVAHWHGFQVLASRSNMPRDAARTLAHRLALASRRALAASCGANELVLAAPRIGVAGITPLLVVPLVGPPPLAVQLLAELAPRSRHTGLAHALRVASLLSTERVGERFFKSFHIMLERMAVSLAGRGTAADRRTAALIALTRVLFLYFVQAKGWMDGRGDYLPALLDAALARGCDFHRQVLSPLFFGTLNRPAAERSPRHLPPGVIPYLNGGLFERHSVERRLGTIAFSNALWRDAFDELFQRFRFCVREADDVTAVAPDMLGHVFERVMDGDDRHVTGTFYTPESVVRQIVGAAIETALTSPGGLSVEAARRAVTGLPLDAPTTARARSALRALRVLDPAVGSGAFLLGMLERLTEIRSVLEGPCDGVSRRQLRREILRDNLFGVDLNPIAVRLAELRLWLAIVADDPTADIASVAPLPNLDGVLRQGDSLFDPLTAAHLLCGPAAPPSHTIAGAVTGARMGMFQARGAARATQVRHLRSAEVQLARELLARAQAAVDHQLRDLAASAAGHDLFGRRNSLPAPQRARYRALRERRAELKDAAAQLREGAVPFFSFHVHAPDTMAVGGFSIVVGNPPWVRAERISRATRRALGERFAWWRSSPGRGYSHLPDLSIAFLERSFEVAKNGGAIALLMPSKLASAAYGTTARGRLVREATLTYVHRVPERETTAFGASTYPLAIVARKAPPPSGHAVRLAFDGPPSVPQHTLGDGPWVLVPDRARDAVRRFLAAGAPLKSLCPPGLGVKTGANGLFLGSVVSLRGTTARVALDGTVIDIEAALLRPAIQGRDVKPFQALSTRVLVWAYAGIQPLATLPPLAHAYFAARAGRLTGRTDYRRGPLWTLFRLPAALAGHRVVWSDIARRPAAVVLDETDLTDAIPVNTCYVARAPDRRTALAITAVLNSTWAWAASFATADEARGGFRRMFARILGAIPLPPESSRATLARVSAVAHQAHYGDQDQVDDAVAHAFDLTPADRSALRSLVAHCR